MTREQKLEKALEAVCTKAKALDPFNIAGRVHFSGSEMGNDEARQLDLDNAIYNAKQLLKG